MELLLVLLRPREIDGSKMCIGQHRVEIATDAILQQNIVGFYELSEGNAQRLVVGKAGANFFTLEKQIMPENVVFIDPETNFAANATLLTYLEYVATSNPKAAESVYKFDSFFSLTTLNGQPAGKLAFGIKVANQKLAVFGGSLPTDEYELAFKYPA